MSGDAKKCKKATNKKRSQTAIQREWIRRAARIAKSSGLGQLAWWLNAFQNWENEAKFKKELSIIRERVKARQALAAR